MNIKSLILNLFNLKKKCHHKISVNQNNSVPTNQLSVYIDNLTYQKMLDTIVPLSENLYNRIEEVVSTIKHPRIIEFKAGETIFNVGDKSDNAYIILQGEVQLLRPSKTLNELTNSNVSTRINQQKILSLILRKGNLFGELGVLNDTVRAATTIAQTDVRLLVLRKEKLKKYISEHPSAQQALSTLQNFYQLPWKGSIEQYFGYMSDLGHIVTNIYKLDDGRKIIASNFLDQNVFMMLIANNEKGKNYRFKLDDRHQITLEVLNNRLIGIKAYDFNTNIPPLCYLLLNNEIVDEELLTQFETIGKLQLPASQREVICTCMFVNRDQLQHLIDEGIRDFDSLSNATGACTVCQGCKYKILQMLGKTS